MEVHNCIHCGTESQPTWRFCRRCGTALENLDQQPAVANCSNCASPVAEEWRFCANCGTGTDSATAAEAGLSEDAVADLIAAPGATVTESAPDAVRAESPPAAQTAAPQPEPEPEPQPEPAAPAPKPERQPTPEPEAAPTEPSISTPQVSFEPTAEVTGAQDATEDGSPPPAAPADVAPPPPPPDPLIDSTDIAAARAEAEAPPAAPAIVGSEPSAAAAEVIEPQDDPFATTTTDNAFEVGEEVVVAAVEDSGEPAVTIPRGEEDPQIRGAMPRPIGADTPPITEVPRPIEVKREEHEAPAPRDEPRRRVAVPDRELDDGEDEEAELPPLDGHFRNPGVLGQVVQLLLITSAALAVAMMVALIVLNNRLDTYATSGESLSRVRSAESMVNTWMRPLLIVGIVITYALLAKWSRRVLDNLQAFNNSMEETPLWMWMMPFVNMWVLFRHLDLAWKGSDYYARGARTWQRAVPDVWTVLFVLLPTLGFVLVLYAWVNGADSFSMAIDSNAFSIIGYFAIAMGLLAGVRSISNIVERQRTRAEGIR